MISRIKSALIDESSSFTMRLRFPHRNDLSRLRPEATKGFGPVDHEELSSAAQRSVHLAQRYSFMVELKERIDHKRNVKRPLCNLHSALHFDVAPQRIYHVKPFSAHNGADLLNELLLDLASVYAPAAAL